MLELIRIGALKITVIIIIPIHTSFDDLDAVTRSQGCQKGKTADCIFFGVDSLCLNFVLLLLYIEKIRPKKLLIYLAYFLTCQNLNSGFFLETK